MNYHKKLFLNHLCTSCLFLLISNFSAAQSVTFELKTSPNLDFTFNTLDEYTNGILLPAALELKVNAIGTQWDLYIGTTTTAAGSWNVTTTYSSVGISPPPISLLEARVYNSNNTSLTGTGFFPLADIAIPVYIIGSNANDPTVNCADIVPTGTNEPGDYTSTPSCYKFKVDLKINPGFNYRPGLYTLRVDYVLIEDL